MFSIFCCFKHKTAYEIRISDWSSDVCSSDLRFKSPAVADFGVERIADAQAIAAAIDTIAGVRLADEIVDYIVRIVRATRESADLECGASPRAATLLARAACAAAALDGRDYAIPDDVQRLAAEIGRAHV